MVSCLEGWLTKYLIWHQPMFLIISPRGIVISTIALTPFKVQSLASHVGICLVVVLKMTLHLEGWTSSVLTHWISRSIRMQASIGHMTGSSIALTSLVERCCSNCLVSTSSCMESCSVLSFAVTTSQSITCWGTRCMCWSAMAVATTMWQAWFKLSYLADLLWECSLPS